MIIPIEPTTIQKITPMNFHGLDLFIKRDDLIDKQISGNKLYKLKYNIVHAKRLGKTAILTFGGAFSNHIVATASLCYKVGFDSIGIIRGEAPSIQNPTLRLASELGMKLIHISRGDYRLKSEVHFLNKLALDFPQAYIIPEGGANLAGILGAKTILNSATDQFDRIICPIGTGTTFAGLVKAAKSHQKVIGITIHRHSAILQDIFKVYPSFSRIQSSRYEIMNDFHFGGYAKWKPELLTFIQQFHVTTGIKLDPIYTGKAMYGLAEIVRNGKLNKENKVLFIHTGGLQGISGFEQRFGIRLFNS